MPKSEFRLRSDWEGNGRSFSRVTRKVLTFRKIVFRAVVFERKDERKRLNGIREEGLTRCGCIRARTVQVHEVRVSVRETRRPDNRPVRRDRPVAERLRGKVGVLRRAVRRPRQSVALGRGLRTARLFRVQRQANGTVRVLAFRVRRPADAPVGRDDGRVFGQRRGKVGGGRAIKIIFENREEERSETAAVRKIPQNRHL